MLLTELTSLDPAKDRVSGEELTRHIEYCFNHLEEMKTKASTLSNDHRDIKQQIFSQFETVKQNLEGYRQAQSH